MATTIATLGARYLYTGADQAVIEKSPFYCNQSPNVVSDVQVRELKLASLFIPNNAVILITQTFLQEASATRLTVSRIVDLVDNGLVRIFTPTLSTNDFVEHKRETYANVRHIPKYRDAYFARTSSRILLPFQFEPKEFNTGSAAHSLWIKEVEELGKLHRIESQLNDALQRISDADTGNSTWESTQKHIQPVVMSKLLMGKLHSLSFTTYLGAHRMHGVGAIVGSRIATYLFTGKFPLLDFDIEIHRQGLSDVQALTDLDSATDTAILRARRHLLELNDGDRERSTPASSNSFYTEVARMLRLNSRTTAMPRDTLLKTLPSRLEDMFFDVALSFPGSHRTLVEQIHGELRALASDISIFYDFQFQSQLARSDLDIVLQRVYEKQSLLLVVFFSQSYAKSEWCGLEWRVIRDLIKKRNSERILLVKLEDVELAGLFSIDGYIDSKTHTAQEIAKAIFERLGTVLPRARLQPP